MALMKTSRRQQQHADLHIDNCTCSVSLLASSKLAFLSEEGCNQWMAV